MSSKIDQVHPLHHLLPMQGLTQARAGAHQVSREMDLLESGSSVPTLRIEQPYTTHRGAPVVKDCTAVTRSWVDAARSPRVHTLGTVYIR